MKHKFSVELQKPCVDALIDHREALWSNDRLHEDAQYAAVHP